MINRYPVLHTENKGSESRANAVTSYTAQNGVLNTCLTAIGKVETAPIATNETEVDSALNRRVEFVITANEALKAEARLT